MEKNVEENFRELLHCFIVNEIELENPVPTEISDFLLGKYLNAVHKTIDDCDFVIPLTDDFIERFQNFLLSKKKSVKKAASSPSFSENSDLKNQVASLVKNKQVEAEKVINILKLLFNLKENIAAVFSDTVEGAKVNVETMEAQIAVLNYTIETRFLKYHPNSASALKMLKSIVENEHNQKETKLNDLLDLDKKHEESEFNPEYQGLLTTYKKLLLRREKALEALKVEMLDNSEGWVL